MARKETKAQQAERVGKVLDALNREYGTEYRCYLLDFMEYPDYHTGENHLYRQKSPLQQMLPSGFMSQRRFHWKRRKT